MAHTNFPVKILTPEGEVFDGPVEMVSTRTSDGLIGVMANHAPLMATLEPTELRLHKSENEILRFAQSEGYLQVGGNQALLLVEEAIPVASLNGEALRERLRAVEAEIAAAPEGSEKRRMAVREKQRTEAFLSLVK